jgi:hypothetical protein
MNQPQKSPLGEAITDLTQVQETIRLHAALIRDGSLAAQISASVFGMVLMRVQAIHGMCKDNDAKIELLKLLQELQGK